MRRTEVERVARKLIEECGLTRENGTEDAFVPLTNTILEKLAAFHLREVRKARGRTVGYVNVTILRGQAKHASPMQATAEEVDVGTDLDSDDGKSRVHRVARVVLAPARRKGGRR